MGLEEAGHDRQQHRSAHDDRRGDRQVPGRNAGLARELSFGALEIGEQLAGALEKSPAGLGQADDAGRPNEELAPKRRSSAATARVTAGGEARRRAAALAKPPLSATATKTGAGGSDP